MHTAMRSIDLFSLHGEVGVVTGGKGGIGLGIARGLAQAGAGVAIAGRNEDKTARAVAEITARGVRSIGLSVDVVEESQVQQMVQDTAAGLAGIDILIANAGTNFRQKPDA